MRWAEAVDEALRLNREHPERHLYSWLPQRVDAKDGRVVRVKRREALSPDAPEEQAGRARPDPGSELPRRDYWGP